MVIRNYAITPRRGIEQSAQGIAMGNRRCRLRPVRAKTSLEAYALPWRTSLSLLHKAKPWAGRLLTFRTFFGSMRTIIFFLWGSFFFFPRPATFPVFVAILSRQAHSAHRSVCEETANRIRSSCGTLDIR